MTIMLPVTTEAHFRLVAIFAWAAPAWKRRCWTGIPPSAACSTAARPIAAGRNQVQPEVSAMRR